MNKISAVIVTFNEENNIEDCLTSLLVVADEIIVVDSFSTDSTKNICKKYRVRFFEHVFEGYVQQKNYALNFAKNNFVLSLDADERLSPELQKLIIKEKNEFTADAYIFNRLNIYCGKQIKHTDWYPDKKLRLWNKEKGEWVGDNPHDKVLMTPDAIQKRLYANFYHYSFRSISEHMAQVNKFTDIAAKEAFARKKKSSLFKAIYKAFGKFVYSYFIKHGFLSGYYGFIISVISAEYSFFKYIKLTELWKKEYL